jgi:cytochrome c
MRVSALAASLVLALALAGCQQPQQAAKAPAGPSPEELTKQIQAALPAPYNTADVAAGRQDFQLCSACHTVIEGGANMTGPNLYGVFGRKAGTHPGYAYSSVVQAAGFVWDPAHLDQWLTAPQTYLKGAKMSFPGLKDPKARADVIAYLAVASAGGPQ